MVWDQQTLFFTRKNFKQKVFTDVKNFQSRYVLPLPEKAIQDLQGVGFPRVVMHIEFRNRPGERPYGQCGRFVI